MTGALRAGAVLFDVDGVLVDSSRDVERHWRAWALAHGVDAARVLERVHGRPSRDTIAEVAPALDAEAEGRRIDAAQAEDAAGSVALPGAAAALAAAGAGRVAVVTSGTRRLATARLAAAGLSPPAVLVTADDVREGKPHPEGYREAARRLGVPASRCVVVEDSPAGVAAARAAGMSVIALTTTHAADELGGDLLLPDLAALAIDAARAGVRLARVRGGG